MAGDTASTGFSFVGFLAPRGAERSRRLAEIARGPSTQIVLEAPHRIAALAAELAAICPERTVTIGRELTKQFESIATMPARDLPGWLGAEEHRSRGEFAVVLHALPVRVEAAVADDHDACWRPCWRPCRSSRPSPLPRRSAARRAISSTRARSSSRASPGTTTTIDSAAAAARLYGFGATWPSCFCAWMFLLARSCMRCR